MKKHLLFILVWSCFYKTTLNAKCIIQKSNNGRVFIRAIVSGWSSSDFAKILNDFLLAKIEGESVRIMKSVFVGQNKSSNNYWPVFNST